MSQLDPSEKCQFRDECLSPRTLGNDTFLRSADHHSAATDSAYWVVEAAQNAAPERRALSPEPQRRTARRERSRSASENGVGRHEVCDEPVVGAFEGHERGDET
jgi:hypothetical protein